MTRASTGTYRYHGKGRTLWRTMGRGPFFCAPVPCRKGARFAVGAGRRRDGKRRIFIIAFLGTIRYHCIDKYTEGTGDTVKIVERYIRDRAFSQLGRLQNAHRIRYSLMLSPGHTATYEIAVDSAQGHSSEARAVTGLCRQKARWILEYLYENAVPAEHWRDVMDDLLAQI